ncbi:hypothetical protein [Actinokineospora sp. NPDC004072]
MAAVTVHQVGAGRADGTSGVLDESTQVQVFAQVSNDDGEPITLGVNFTVADRTEAVGLSVGAGETQWAQYVVGTLPAGTHPLDVLVYAEVDGTSQVLGQQQGQFTVGAATATTGYVQPPDLDITVFRFDPKPAHGLHPSHGRAYDSEGGRLTVQVRNMGAEQSGTATLTMVAGAEFANHEIDLAGSEEVQFTLDVDELAAGEAQVYAYITMEINNSSQSLAQKELTLEVVPAPVRENPELGHTTIDFSLAVHVAGELGGTFLLDDYAVSVRFVGDDQQTTSPSETEHCDIISGVFACDGVMIPRGGWIIVAARNHEGDELSGTLQYDPEDVADGRLSVSATQQVAGREFTASSTQEIADEVETSVRATASYAFIEAEAGRTWKRGETESWGEERSGTLYYPLADLELKVEN